MAVQQEVSTNEPCRRPNLRADADGEAPTVDLAAMRVVERESAPRSDGAD